METMTIQRRTISLPEGESPVVYIKFKKHRLPRKYKKKQIKLGNKEYLKLVASTNFINYRMDNGFDNFVKEGKLIV